MANTGFFHHIGTFLLFAAAILLLITTISAPVINDISILKVKLINGSTTTFGTFGHCVLNVDQSSYKHDDYCSGKHIGYNPANIMERVDGTNFGTAATNTSKALTRVMILHPIACGLALISFLLALGAGVCGAILAALVSALTFVITVVVVACDFVLFGIVKNHVNDDDDGTGSHAKFGPGIWALLAALILLFFGTFVVLFTCFSARRHKKSARHTKGAEAGFVGNGGTVTTTKRHFWQRRSRY